MKRYILFFLLFLVSAAFAQSPGVSQYGAVRSEGEVFVSRYGERLDFPRLDQYGQILYYAPLVAMDSILLSDTVVTTARFYGKVLFDGWSPILSCGFDYATSPDFSGFQRVECVAGLGRMASVVAGLSYNQQYYVRSFATNRYGTTFADTFSFRTTVGPVTIESVRAEVNTPYSFGVTVRIGERGGLPVSGDIALFADGELQHLIADEPFDNLTSDQVSSTFPSLEPATTYYSRAILTNGIFADTVFLMVRTPSDLVLTIESDKASSVALCSGGTLVTYRAMLTGSDRNKSHYDFLWTSSIGAEFVQDTLFPVLYETAGTYEVSVKAFYGEDTIVARVEQVIRPRSGMASFYVCTNEFLNTAEATTTNIASIRWLDEHNNVVDTKNSVKLPTGYYTVECTDNYGCVLSKEVYVGKKKLSCIVSDTPGSHESARYEDGVWKIDSISDEDGYWYAVTQIGRLCWLRQNLRTRHLPSTHQDLLGTGANHRPNMQYADGTYIYKPESTPYMGSLYTWCAAVDVPYAGYNYEYNFPKQHRGICPPGWHLPNKDEIWEIVDTMLNLCCEGVDYMPAPGTHLIYVAQNTPINDMMRTCCYDSYSNPSYPQEIYDAFNLSIPREQPLEHRFWLIDLAEAERTALALYVSNQPGIMIGVGVRVTTYMPVRCVRNYQEE